MRAAFAQPPASSASKPLVGVLCSNDFHERPVQSVATRFIDPLTHVSGVDVLLVPAISAAIDPKSVASRLDGLLLTGSRSNVAPSAYGGKGEVANLDPDRDAVAFALAAELIDRGKPVFGICRGLQEINVLFGGSLRADVAHGHQHPDSRALAFEHWFGHRHDVQLSRNGVLHAGGPERIQVTSVHEQGVDRLGADLRVDAVAAEDGLIEAVVGTSAPVLAVQWHPECDAHRCGVSRRFFELFGRSAAGGGLAA
ncbi:gamma-glutamyl-gamma-aminobutyrate hydrolase family protein [Sphingomonas piscis]|uniref:Gamma-glutamyl-gamma-aminobutyrate hydrolase family protein n=1 Tax=Sphingomonas piscis TaxID=2714943 RepID=A0A6G7YS29_9SPHN|nr:gamma-glutamyl-gamma-aminobutyrate hydrolase family protein [Sphingomonas piscis]QIK79539.1 gamma-glutamyl-gamma-aminobutyrate hydrolase family protein [Sphingomonas piscis]